MKGTLSLYATSSVLVVDDSAPNLALARALLEEAGLVRVTTEADPRRVADLLPEIDPDLVLLDLHMPHLNGLSVLKQIERYAAGTYLPVLVLTADASTPARNEALANGAKDFLTKPLDGHEVILRVANLLQTRALFREIRPSRADPVVSSDSGELQQRVHDVIEQQAWTTVYQPVVAVEDRAVVGHEALSRFVDHHPRGPAGWFSDAFDADRGVDLEWAAMLRALPFLDTAPAGTFLALNASPATILNLNYETLCPPELYPHIVIELTEHVPVEDYPAIHRALEAIRGHGARLAADDLGSGYAGLRHLLALSPDIVKLDMALISGIHKDPSARALVRAIVAFADEVGATLIAEGIEQPEELDTINELGVHWAQGYLLGRPAPAPVRA